MPESKVVKNRVHLDLGASVQARYEAWITLTDAEGNEFCVLAGGD